MAASVEQLIDTLEQHLAQTQQELATLREENGRLKAELAQKAPAAASEPASQTEVEAESTSLKSHTEPVTPPAHEPLGDQIHPPVQAARDPSAPPSPHALLKQWYERYPNAFFTGHTKPLKVGIHQDLAKREPWSGKLIRRALANYVNLPRYVKSMREGVERVDLDGMPAGKVDKEASLHASERRKDQVGEKAGEHVDKKAARNVAEKAQQAPKKPALHRGDRPASSNAQRPAQSSAPEKNEERKPLSMEEKIKGLMQKFEGR